MPIEPINTNVSQYSVDIRDFLEEVGVPNVREGLLEVWINAGASHRSVPINDGRMIFFVKEPES